ncbi:(2Fe-2S)-binding protein [Cupriavidus necator]|uniref:(2Fe-2S)-binding protein n=1 Tax=Cupriavidus necator TaxID=106590 RepID=UPI0005B4A952|nr:(2Fe-2S)-binding protein [Cupriavidus necator]
MTIFKLNVNGKPHTVSADGDTPLLYVLRNELGLHGPKFGCGLGQCGACTVLLDGTATRSCLLPVSTLRGANIVTLEGLGTPERPHPLQSAFIKEQAVQCGYCISGMVMSAAGLLKSNAAPSESEIREALAGNLCRCGTHTRIIKAVRRAAAFPKEEI